MKWTRRGFLEGAAVTALLGRRAEAKNAETGRDVAWLEEVQRAPERLPADAPKLGPLLVDENGKPITKRADWEMRRAWLRRRWLEFLGEIRVERPGAKMTVLEEDFPEGCVRRLVRYESEPGLPVEGYLLSPKRVDRPRPGVVALHSTVDHTIRQPAGLEGPPEKFYGLKLAQRGYVAFCPRCFLWQGDGTYLEQVDRFRRRHRGVTGMAKMLWDASRGLDILASLKTVDAGRLGAVGHSLGAKEALYLAAFDERVKVAVSSEGGIGTRFSNWDAPWYLGPRAKRDDFAREHHELLALVAPRPFLLIGGDSADGARSWPFIDAALPVYDLYGRPRRVGLFNHRKGHAVPPESERRTYEWFDAYL